MEETVNRVKVFEGFRLNPYLCPAGKLTIGYGYNYEDRGFDTDVLTEILRHGFSEVLAERLLKADVERCYETLEKLYPFFHRLNDVRRSVLADMLYQLGISGFRSFRRMLSAIETDDFGMAAEEMKNSLWYRQSGRRSIVNTAQMRTGVWEDIG